MCLSLLIKEKSGAACHPFLVVICIFNVNDVITLNPTNLVQLANASSSKSSAWFWLSINVLSENAKLSIQNNSVG